jgi:transcriptional regulator with XRE-family HTH domain
MQELDYAKVGARIRQIRKAKGWSQDELAKKCGISMNFMGHIERGTRKMSLDTFARICAGLEANADALLWGVVQESQAMIQDLWKQPKKADSDSYSMYIQIMKSVADIMRSKDENQKQRVKE